MICSVCGKVLIEGEEVSVDDTAHVEKLAKTLKAATCTTTGLGKYVCELCGENLGYKTIAAEHAWDDGVVTTEATCGEDGEKLYTCSVCGEEKNEVIPATDEHTFEEQYIDATCEEPAKVGEKCSVCGEEGETEVVADSEPLGHDPVLDTTNKKYVAATCEEGGLDTFKCSRCDYTKEEETEALGHDYDDGEYVDADCENGAGVKYTCSLCGDSYVDELKDDLAVPALGHTEEAVEDIPATCKTTGWTGKVICSVCGKVTNEGEVAPVDSSAHKDKLEKTIREATCTTTGIGKYVCELCGEDLGYKTIPASHSWDEGTVVTEATCGKAGEITYTCTVCSEEKTEEIPATGEHKWTEGYVDATCTEPAKVGTVCEICGAADGAVTEIGEPAGHKYEEELSTEPTCTEAGEATYTCSVCGDSYTETVPALGHTEGEAELVEATCTENGKSVVKCTVCGEVVTEDDLGNLDPATGHTPVAMDEVAATCTKAGSTGGKGCSVCEAVIEQPKETPVDSDAHNYELTSTLKEATCTTNGYGKYTCADCSTTATKVILAAHSWDDVEHIDENTNAVYHECTSCGARDIIFIEDEDLINCAKGEHTTEVVPRREATCTEAGYTGGEVCTICGAITSGEEIPALGHKTEIQNAKEATCTETGYTGDEVCTVCGETVTEGKEINALGHYYEGKFNDDDTITYTCKNCGDSYTE